MASTKTQSSLVTVAIVTFTFFLILAVFGKSQAVELNNSPPAAKPASVDCEAAKFGIADMYISQSSINEALKEFRQ